MLRNLLSAGDFVEIVPFGIPVSLVYRPEGGLKDAKLGFDETKSSDYDKRILNLLVKKHSVPPTVFTQGNTHVVYGVLYSNRHILGNGKVPNCLVSEALKLYEHRIEFKFLAGSVASDSFKSAATGAYIQSWMKMQKFDVLPGMLWQNEAAMQTIRNSSEISGSPVMGYFVFRGHAFQFYDENKELHEVTKLEPKLGIDGILYADVTFDKKDVKDFNYFSTVVQHNVKKHDFVVMKDGQIESNYYSQKRGMNSNEVTCSVCGRKYELTSQITVCPNKHCLSHLYEDFSYFLRYLKLPTMTFDEYKEFVQNGSLQVFGDVLKLDKYKDIKLQVTVEDVLLACISPEHVSDRLAIMKLCATCTSFKSISYYLTNAFDISQDLGIDCKDLVEWLEDDYNVNTLFDVFNSPNVEIQSGVVAFDGAPIFRGKSIYLTGSFTHGSIDEVKSILRSYSAEFSDYASADCVLIGDIPENVNGAAVNYARNYNIPVISESEFFTQYDIDSDIDAAKSQLGDK